MQTPGRGGREGKGRGKGKDRERERGREGTGKGKEGRGMGGEVCVIAVGGIDAPAWERKI